MVRLGQLVRHWIVESWSGKDSLAFCGPCSNKGSVHKLGGARADQAQAKKNDSSYWRGHASGEVLKEETYVLLVKGRTGKQRLGS